MSWEGNLSRLCPRPSCFQLSIWNNSSMTRKSINTIKGPPRPKFIREVWFWRVSVYCRISVWFLWYKTSCSGDVTNLVTELPSTWQPVSTMACVIKLSPNTSLDALSIPVWTWRWCGDGGTWQERGWAMKRHLPPPQTQAGSHAQSSPGSLV